jgi:ElaB/YqjD/DUF883 family membrane-anchored ribosome-binding protein
MNKKDAKKKIDAMKKKMQLMTAKELKRAQVEMAKAAKKVEEIIKKNPEKAAIVAAGIGAAVGAAITALVTRKKK